MPIMLNIEDDTAQVLTAASNPPIIYIFGSLTSTPQTTLIPSTNCGIIYLLCC
jgi:hypothetical protein